MSLPGMPPERSAEPMKRRPSLLVVLALLPLAACASREERFEPPPLIYDDRPRLDFVVGEVEIEQRYRPVGAAPFIDHAMPLAPAEAVRALLQARIQAIGDVGAIRAVIEDASMKEVPLETTGGLKGVFTKEPEFRLEGRVEVSLERLDEQGRVATKVGTAAARSTTIPEDVGFVERQRIAYELVKTLVDDLDRGLEENARKSFGAWLAR
jgi:hypothetical protein